MPPSRPALRPRRPRPSCATKRSSGRRSSTRQASSWIELASSPRKRGPITTGREYVAQSMFMGSRLRGNDRVGTMQRSTERILTTHVGSLPRPPDLLQMVQNGAAFDAPANAARLRAAVNEIVKKQIELELDVIDDGEFGKPSFVSYVNERLGGFEFEQTPRGRPWAHSREAIA